MRVTGVRIATQGIDDEYIEILQEGNTDLGDVAHVGEVGGAAEAIAGDLLASVGYGDSLEAGAEQLDSSSGREIDAMDLHARAGGVAVFLAKGVFEDAFDVVCGFLIRVDRQEVVATEADRGPIVADHAM